MHTRTRRLRLHGALLLTGLAFLLSMFPAQASVKGRKTTAAVLAGVAAYHLVKGHTTEGLVAGAGAAYAWKRSQDAEKAQKRARACRYRRTSSRRHYTSSRHHHHRSARR